VGKGTYTKSTEWAYEGEYRLAIPDYVPVGAERFMEFTRASCAGSCLDAGFPMSVAEKSRNWPELSIRMSDSAEP
jgi:hypothetical protein